MYNKYIDKIKTMENLTLSEVIQKIEYLENAITYSIARNGTSLFCINRIKRVEVLKSYFN